MSNTEREVFFYDPDDEFSNGTKEKLICKFILVWDEQSLSLLFGPPSKFPYHAFLLDRFCTDNQIPSSWTKLPDVVEVYAPHIHVRGGGWMDINFNSKTVSFEGESRAYGIYDRTALVELIEKHSYFEEYDWSVE